MTNHKKTYIEPKDINAVRFDCNDCGASVTLPLGIQMNFNSISQCPNCGRPWAVIMQTSIQSELKRCADAIMNAKIALAKHQETVQNTGSTKGFTVSLELSEPSVPASDAKGD